MIKRYYREIIIAIFLILLTIVYIAITKDVIKHISKDVLEFIKP